MDILAVVLVVAAVVAVIYYRDEINAWRSRRPRTTKIVTKQRKRTSTGVHVFLSIITLGLWIPVWFAVALWNVFGPRARRVTRIR